MTIDDVYVQTNFAATASRREFAAQLSNELLQIATPILAAFVQRGAPKDAPEQALELAWDLLVARAAMVNKLVASDNEEQWRIALGRDASPATLAPPADIGLAKLAKNRASQDQRSSADNAKPTED